MIDGIVWISEGAISNELHQPNRKAAIEKLLDPTAYTGLCAQMAHDAATRARATAKALAPSPWSPHMRASFCIIRQLWPHDRTMPTSRARDCHALERFQSVAATARGGCRRGLPLRHPSPCG